MNSNFFVKTFVLISIQKLYHSSTLKSEGDHFSKWEDISNFVASPMRINFENDNKINYGPTSGRKIIFGEDNKPSLIQDGVCDGYFSENKANIGVCGLLDERTAKCVTKSETSNELFLSRSGMNCTIMRVLDLYPKNTDANLEIPFDDEATDYDMSPPKSTYLYLDPSSNEYKFCKRYTQVTEANAPKNKNKNFSSDLPPLIPNKMRRYKSDELEINKKKIATLETKSSFAEDECINKGLVCEENDNFIDSASEIISSYLPKREKHERNKIPNISDAKAIKGSKMKITTLSECENIIPSSQSGRNDLFGMPPESQSLSPFKNEGYEKNKNKKQEKNVTGKFGKTPSEKINKKKETSARNNEAEEKKINKSSKSGKNYFFNSFNELPTSIQFESFDTEKIERRPINTNNDKRETPSAKIKSQCGIVNRGSKVDEIIFRDSAVDVNAKIRKNNKNTKYNAKEINIPRSILLKTEKYEKISKAKKTASPKIRNVLDEYDNIYYSKNYKNDLSDTSEYESDVDTKDAKIKRDSKLKTTNSKSRTSNNQYRKINSKNEKKSPNDYKISRPKSRGPDSKSPVRNQDSTNSSDYSTAKEMFAKSSKKVVGLSSPYVSDDSEEEITSKENAKFKKRYIIPGNSRKDVKSKSEKSSKVAYVLKIPNSERNSKVIEMRVEEKQTKSKTLTPRGGKKIKNYDTDAVYETAYDTPPSTPKSKVKKNDTSSKTRTLLSKKYFRLSTKTKNIIKKIKDSILEGKTEDDFKLTRIVVMFRHGIRAPGIIKSFTDTPRIYWENQRGFRNGPNGPQLTQRGLDIMYDLGVRIKRRYPNLLRIPEGKTFPRSVRAYSTPYQRTMDSMRAVLTGIYLPIDYPQIIINDSYPIFNCRKCPRYLLELGNIRRNGYDNPYERELADIFSKHSKNKSIGTDEVFSIVDTILCEEAMKIDQPEWIQELLDNKDILFYRHYRWAASSWTDTMKRLRVGAWLSILIQPIRDTLKGKKSSEVHLHALHDILIHNIIMTLKPLNSHFYVFDVYFGASLTIEIWKDLTVSKPLYYLKVLFSTSTLLNNFVMLKLPFCQVPTMCTAEEFIAGVEKYIPDDLEKECSI